MRIFVKAEEAKKPRTHESRNIAYMYAAILVIFALSQLFTFDKFLVLIDSFWLPGGTSVAYLLAGVIVSSEVFALPFLLGMKISPLMRVLSMGLSWLVPFIWFLLAVWINFTVNAVSNIGFLGTVVILIPGWWAIFFTMSIGLLSAWASWGMWPFKRGKNTKQ